MGQRGRNALKTATTDVVSAAFAEKPWDLPHLNRAERVIRFAETLPCSAGFGAGEKFRLRGWQKKFIRSVYRCDNHGRRLVRTAVFSAGRGSGKTTLAALLALAHIAGPEAVSRGQVLSAANDRGQAALIFNEVAAIVLRTPWLKRRINVRRAVKQLDDLDTGTTYAALSRESGTVHGLSPTVVIYDELAQSGDRDLLDALSTAMAKRPEPLLIVISTQAPTDHAPLSTLIDYGLRIERGDITDPTFHLTFYRAPVDADPWVRTSWEAANPALGDFLSLEDVARQALQAQRMPAGEPAFRNLILNQRVDTSPQFLNLQLWKACGQECGRKELPYACYGGLDLGATRDMTALVLVFARPDGTYDAIPYCWLPGETLGEREDEDRMPYKLWARQGYLQTFPGRSTDPKVVALKIAELHGQFKIRQLAFDRWRIEDLKRELDDIGCNVELVPFGQGFKDMGPSIDTLERLVETQKLRHGNHPVLTMAASNARIETDAVNNRKLSKKRSNGRIDPLVALAMALGVATRHVEQHAVTPVAVWV
jgi:phage terminase large subunit-like protein